MLWLYAKFRNMSVSTPERMPQSNATVQSLEIFMDAPFFIRNVKASKQLDKNLQTTFTLTFLASNNIYSI